MVFNRVEDDGPLTIPPTPPVAIPPNAGWGVKNLRVKKGAGGIAIWIPTFVGALIAAARRLLIFVLSLVAGGVGARNEKGENSDDSFGEGGKAFNG